MMSGLSVSLVVIFWVLLGIIPCRLLWYAAFRADPAKWLVILSALGGPVLGAVHVIGFVLVTILQLFGVYKN